MATPQQVLVPAAPQKKLGMLATMSPEKFARVFYDLVTMELDDRLPKEFEARGLDATEVLGMIELSSNLKLESQMRYESGMLKLREMLDVISGDDEEVTL